MNKDEFNKFESELLQSGYERAFPDAIDRDIAEERFICPDCNKPNNSTCKAFRTDESYLVFVICRSCGIAIEF